MSKDTYHTRTIVDDELGGRFKREGPTVVGSTPAPSYPPQPAISPWSKSIDAVTGVEPPLGFSVNDLGGSMAPADAPAASDVATCGPPKPERPSDDPNQ